MGNVKGLKNARPRKERKRKTRRRVETITASERRKKKGLRVKRLAAIKAEGQNVKEKGREMSRLWGGCRSESSERDCQRIGNPGGRGQEGKIKGLGGKGALILPGRRMTDCRGGR